ncbi:shikimate dehydrogenase, partial [bacterium]
MKPFEWQEAPAADFAVIGDPVAHSRSPQMHNAAFKALGLDFKYVAVHVPPGEVKAALSHLAELGYQGINVTVPHKEEAIGWCLHVDKFVTEVQAVNTIDLERKAGINTDAGGFLATLPELPTKTALVLGAGGSARALA